MVSVDQAAADRDQERDGRSPLLRRRRFRVVGVAQGVGFRPFVARLASELSLAGFVRNTTSAVVMEVQGRPEALAEFAVCLESGAPRAAIIEYVEAEDLPVREESGFQIAASAASGDYSAGMPPDLATCPDCLRELFDPHDRRYHYPFLNCTACGPRYSIVTGLPYDRPQTTLRDFPLCDDCRSEYADPLNRRYHAQPIACPACGPSLSESMRQAVEALREGKIVAIRGIGGFHLACDARHPGAIQVLRNRKGRGDQPFAMMVRDMRTAREFVTADEQAERLLASPAAPIVLLPKAGSAGDPLAPGNGYLGVFLPYSPLHHLLLAQIPALVMTSGNRHGEPIVTDNEAATERLAGLADTFLFHNRAIAAPCDDSVVRLYRGRPLAIRRGRGYAPLRLRVPVEIPTLATGADLKSALALGSNGRAYISPHIGDMENLETLEAFERTFRHLSTLYRIAPRRIVHDAHPGYLSTDWARRQGIPTLAIQHHRAHAASVLAEYAVAPETSVVAVVFDGTGYGEDGAIWGGEFFVGAVAGLRRAAHLPYVPLPGGDACAKRPALSALAHLHAAGIDAAGTCAWQSLTPGERRVTARQLERKLNCHPSSSMGRLFDAAASLLGIRHRIEYEAQAAIELEALAAAHPAPERYHASAWQLADLWREMREDGASATAARARRFTGCVAAWTCSTAQGLASATGTVVLSGGVFQNVLLLESVTAELESAGLRVLTPRYLPPNDGGIALGQLYLSSFVP